jgi:hypothetical protein
VKPIKAESFQRSWKIFVFWSKRRREEVRGST